MKKRLNIEGLDCLCCVNENTQDIAYILYPMDVLGEWIETASQKYGVSIVVITGMDWDNVLSPWPAPGQPPGSPDFRGESKEFLEKLQKDVIPWIENQLGFTSQPLRTLVGVSMSGLFALWQWMLCDTFLNIASLSGSFWFPGFIEWMRQRVVPAKKGKGFFLLGKQESKSNIKTFDSVGKNTAEIISILEKAEIKVEFQSVPGNHYSDPLPRLDKAFSALFPSS